MRSACHTWATGRGSAASATPPAPPSSAGAAPRARFLGVPRFARILNRGGHKHHLAVLDHPHPDSLRDLATLPIRTLVGVEGGMAAGAVVRFTRSRAHASIRTVLSGGLEIGWRLPGPPVPFDERAAAVGSSGRSSGAAGDPRTKPHSGVRCPMQLLGRCLNARPCQPPPAKTRPDGRDTGKHAPTVTALRSISLASLKPAPRPTDYRRSARTFWVKRIRRALPERLPGRSEGVHPRLYSQCSLPPPPNTPLCEQPAPPAEKHQPEMTSRTNQPRPRREPAHGVSRAVSARVLGPGASGAVPLCDQCGREEAVGLCTGWPSKQ